MGFRNLQRKLGNFFLHQKRLALKLKKSKSRLRLLNTQKRSLHCLKNTHFLYIVLCNLSSLPKIILSKRNKKERSLMIKEKHSHFLLHLLSLIWEHSQLIHSFCLKFIYSEKATKFLFYYVVVYKQKRQIFRLVDR